MQALLSLITAAAVALTGAGGLSGPEPSPAPAAVDWEDMDYTSYDPEWFYDRVDRLTRLAAGHDSQTVLDLYDELYGEYVRMDTLSAIAYVRHCADMQDEYWAEESARCDALCGDAADTLMAACQAVTQGPCADAFRAHVGADAAEAFARAAAVTDRELELSARESELVEQYHTLMASSDDITYSYLGETWTWEAITGFQGTSLSNRDYEGYLEVYYGLQEELNDRVGPVFLELVGLRTELAELSGYESYSDMAYEQYYARSYGPGQAQALCEAVRAIGPDYYDDLYYSDLWYTYDALWPALEGEELLQALGEQAVRLDPALAEPWDYMTGRGLYDIGQGENRYPGFFTLPLSQYGSAFIFAELDGTGGDLSGLAHEFGHFVYDCRHPAPDLLTSAADYDLLELHALGLEALLARSYDAIYADGADEARFLVLGDLMESVLEGCIYDEFQRQVYARPDMTLDQINQLFAATCAQYGLDEPMDVDYGWMYVPHTFEQPFYYISYAASALGAIQLWDLARDDLPAAVDVWEQLMDADAYTEGYMETLPACGLRLFTEEDAVEDVCRPLLRELKRLDEAVG